jgi:predicted MPP superfamily phosphohydrolase
LIPVPKGNTVQPKDFTHNRFFPGTEGNPFDSALRKLENLQKLHSLIFAGLLFILSWIPSYLNLLRAAGLFAFFLLDWLLVALLSRSATSYGPPRPPVLVLAILRVPFAFFPAPYWIIFQAIGTAMVIYAFWVEPHRLTVTRQFLASSKLAGEAPIRVLHLGDLHLERITRRERKLNQLISELQPDLILFSGDIFNLSNLDDPVAFHQARELISGWRAPQGVYFVSGSEAVDLPQLFPRIIEGLDVHWLNNQKTSITSNGNLINLIGLTCTHRPFLDAPVLETLAAGSGDQFNLLLYHSPDVAPQAAQLGIDLQLSGHTHGGQVCLPLFGPLFTASLYGREFRSGRYQIGGLTLYITRGIGMEGKAAPRVRFLCPPEIILWELSGTSVVK